MNRVDSSGNVATGSTGPRLSPFGIGVTVVVGVVAAFAIMAATGVFDENDEQVATTTSAASTDPREVDAITRFALVNPVDPASDDAIIRYAQTTLAATRADDAILRYADSLPVYSRSDDAILRYADANLVATRADDAILRYADSQPIVSDQLLAAEAAAAARADDAILRFAENQSSGFQYEDAIQRWAAIN